MKKRIFSLIMVAALSLSLLSGCGSKGVTLEAATVNMYEAGDTTQLKVEGKGELKWSTSDASVVTVDNAGTIVAVAPGTATVTVTDGKGNSASCTVNCKWEAAVNADLTAFYNDLVAQYGENFPANMDVTEMPDMVEGFFPGLTAIETNQCLIYQPMMGAVVCEIALIEVANAADVKAVEDILNARIAAQVDGGAWYPESIEGWQNNSRVVSNGNYVMMIAYSECDAVVDAFNDLF